MFGRLHLLYILMFFVLASFATGCTPKVVDYGRLNTNLQETVKEAEKLSGEGKYAESGRMIDLASKLHPSDDRVKKVVGKIPADLQPSTKEKDPLGFNRKTFRGKYNASVSDKVVWYIPDRIKDLLDIVTAECNIGYELGAGIWATRALQAVAYTGVTANVSLYQQKLGPGARFEGTGEFVIGPAGGTGLAGFKAGLLGVATNMSSTAFHSPYDPMYQEYRDYWGIGGKIGLLVIGCDVEAHPLEVVDFLTGLVGVNYLGDDLATSKVFDFTVDQKTLISDQSEFIMGLNDVKKAEYKKQYPSLFKN